MCLWVCVVCGGFSAVVDSSLIFIPEDRSDVDRRKELQQGKRNTREGKNKIELTQQLHDDRNWLSMCSGFIFCLIEKTMAYACVCGWVV